MSKQIRCSHLLLLLVVLQLALALTFVQAGLFEFIDKNKNSKPKPRPNDDASRQKNDRQADELAEELESLSKKRPIAGNINKLHRPEVDLDTLLEMANENTNYNSKSTNSNSRNRPGGVAPAVLSRDIPADLPPELANPVVSDPVPGAGGENSAEKPLKRAPRPNLSSLQQLNQNLNPSAPKSSSAFSGMSKLTSASFLNKKLKGAYKHTKETLKPVKNTLIDLPKYVGQATDSVSALLKLDKGSALREMMLSLDESILFVREEFSKFTINWAPRVEAAINYIGLENLYKLKWSDRDELDLRRDALNTLGFGYEFMNMMLIWRRNLLSTHEAFRIYLQSVQQDLLGSSDTKVDEYFIYQLKAIHNYMIFKSWLQSDAEMLEPRMKLSYLSSVADEQPKNYESDYFRYIVFFQELYEPTLTEFKSERKQVIEAVSTSSALGDAFKEVDEFLDDFQNHLNEDEELRKRIEVPQELSDFMEKVRPEVIYNPRLYQKEFLKDLKEAKKKLLKIED